MNPKAQSNAIEEINGTIINVSFPRSGHRFLRVILSDYFEPGFFLHKHHRMKIGDKLAQPGQLKHVNIIKTHDFKLEGKKVLSSIFPINRKYLVQIRHPLESIVSYYEFALKFGDLPVDNEATWRAFLAGNLRYWKQFYKLWAVDTESDSLVITYDDLFNNTFETTQQAVSFLSGQTSVNSEKLAKAIENQIFLRYDNDSRSKQQERRQITSFKYFNEKKFRRIEKNLISDHLRPHGIKLLFHQDRK